MSSDESDESCDDGSDDDDEEDASRLPPRQGVVVYTGAGVSTAVGIPDFRGPNGVWTMQAQGRPQTEFKVPFGAARPSFTHVALRAMVATGYVKYVVSQNVDGLHMRSGLTRKEELAVRTVHGTPTFRCCRD